MLVYKINGQGKTKVIRVHYGIPGPQGVKGDTGAKGEPFRYDDFTKEQLEGLKGVGVNSITSREASNGTYVTLHLTDNSEYQFFVAKGIKGETGATGPKGDTGVGIPKGGQPKCVLAKEGYKDYEVRWDSLYAILLDEGFDIYEIKNNVNANSETIANHEESISIIRETSNSNSIRIDRLSEDTGAIRSNFHKLTHPTEGQVGQVLTLANNPQGVYKAVWQDPQDGLPSGGSFGNVIMKNSNGDAEWANIGIINVNNPINATSDTLDNVLTNIKDYVDTQIQNEITSIEGGQY